MATTALYFTTGQAARELGASLAQIRALCEAGAVEAEITPGRQWRIPADELARLKRDGLPPTPRPLPDERGSRLARNSRARQGHADLLAEPSNDVVSAAEQVAITRSQLEKRKIERALEETEDWFRERDYEKVQREADRGREERTRQTEESRTDWLQQAEEYALRRIHPDIPAEMRLAALESVRARLEPLTPQPSAQVTAEIISAALELALGPWIRLADMAAVFVEIREKLPREFRDSPEVRTAAVAAAVPAMNDLLTGNIHARLGDLSAVAAAPIHVVVCAFRHDHRIQKLLDDHWWLRLPDGTAEEQAQAKAAVEAALHEQPFSTSDRDMEKARDSALAPFHAAVDRARTEQQAKAQEEARKIRERNYRNSLKKATWVFPWDMLEPDRERARAAIGHALDALPEGTQERDLQAARDRAMKPFLDRHADWKHKDELVTTGLGEVYRYLLKLEAERPLSKGAYTLKCELEPVIRKQLDGEVTGNERADDIAKKVRRLVREHLDVPRPTAQVLPRG